ncbi:uncharacterized protein LOC116340941 [Contarinia nasturtii]|uniref:uncharacterized protein LOC116340941 n=1 Tax=Contarinia nasturtii TaxID=265458 RepID=UPI0012D3B604|nr:uncharacterized protein LOC116340941 [Contarinia nasturtii]XP_031623566.1 uncharacterized protein LOC116340941 [Contarinia nasturtii]
MRFQVIFPSLAVLSALLLTIMDFSGRAIRAQEQTPLFELPVQLVGFPVIILAVRFSNFVKKLAYSVNPKTYQSRVRRASLDYSLSDESMPPMVDIDYAQKKILDEYGPKACIIEEPCKDHSLRQGRAGAQPDWLDILRNYKIQRGGMKQWYLLSVFIGDVIRDPTLCKRLAKRIPCNRDITKAHVKY